MKKTQDSYAIHDCSSLSCNAGPLQTIVSARYLPLPSVCRRLSRVTCCDFSASKKFCRCPPPTKRTATTAKTDDAPADRAR